MKIYLIRHGIAELKSTDRPDFKRMLSSKGIIKTQKVARKLANLKIKFDIILTSPYQRAKETAIILKQAQLSEKIIEHLPLKPEGNILESINWLQEANYKPDACICFVGHQPDLAQWAELLIWGKSNNKLVLKKAGVIGLELSNLEYPLGDGELFLVTSPKWFTA